MPKQLVWSVHQRSTATPGLERELAMFTDDALANQAIEHLYRYARNELVTGVYDLLWFNPTTAELVKKKQLSEWMTDELNSDRSIFFKRPHELWNQVPPNAIELNFVQEVIDLGNVPVMEVKRKF